MPINIIVKEQTKVNTPIRKAINLSFVEPFLNIKVIKYPAIAIKIYGINKPMV